MWGRVPRFGGNDSPFGPPAAAEMVAALPLAQYVAPITTTEGQLAVLFDLETARCAWGVVWWGTFVVVGGELYGATALASALIIPSLCLSGTFLFCLLQDDGA